MELTIRPARPDDAEAMLAHVEALAREPGIDVPLEPGEFQVTPEEERRILRQAAESANSAFFTAWEGDELLGLLHLRGGELPSGRHRATLGMSVSGPARGRGVGRALLEDAVAWARANPWLTRLELDVYDRNAPARHLYEDVGFAYEARRRAAVREGAAFLDTWLMGLCFEGKAPRPYETDDAAYRPAPRAPAHARVHVRDARPPDAQAVLDLWREQRRDPALLVPTAGLRQVPCEAAFRQRFAAGLHAENTHLVLAEAQGRLVGVAEARGQPRRALCHEALVAIGVADGWRGRGVGRRLLEVLESRARAGGILRRLMLHVYAENAAARRLYRSCGYEDEGQRRAAWFQNGRTHDEWVMARLLD